MSVCKTTDSGGSWSRYNFGTATGYLYALAMDPTNSNTVYAGGYENSAPAVYKTTNGGSTWNKLAASGLSGYVYALAIDPDNPDMVYAGTSSSLYRSTDGGSSFSTIGFPGGRTQTILIDWTSFDADIIYAGTYSNGVYCSSNGGSTWDQMNDGLDVLNINCLSLDPTSYLFAGTNGGSAYRWEILVGTGEHTRESVTENILYAYPNPVIQHTSITYNVYSRTDVLLSVYDTQGRSVTTLVNEIQDPGTRTVMWDCCDKNAQRVAAGVYFLKLNTELYDQVYKMIILK
jgi:hypothetical protein